MADSYYNGDGENDNNDNYGNGYFDMKGMKWLSLVVVACVSFWCQSIVTEDRLVPALNIISDHWNIPDDIAGATLIAAGASSPELLCTLVSLFITHSSLGLGTIVGSEIFNQLIICAGSIYATRPKRWIGTNVDRSFDKHDVGGQTLYRYLVLDKVMVLREVSFYALSIGLLYIALKDARYDNDDKGYDRIEYVYVTFWKALLLFGGYILYVAVCSNMGSLLIAFGTFQHILKRIRSSLGSGNSSDDETIDPGILPESTAEYVLSKEDTKESVNHKSFDDLELHGLPFIYNISTEPVENWADGLAAAAAKPSVVRNNYPEIRSGSSSTSAFNNMKESIELHEKSRGMNFYDGTQSCHISTEIKQGNITMRALHKFNMFGRTRSRRHQNSYPVEINDVYELTNSLGEKELGCFLFQRSIFYKAYLGSHAFQLRWFSITPRRILSVPNRHEPHKHMMVYPLFDEIQVDHKRLIINIVHPVQGKRDFTLMAPNRAVFDAAVHALKDYMLCHRSLRLAGTTYIDELGDDFDYSFDSNVCDSEKTCAHDIDADPHDDLIDFPSNVSKLEIIFWILLYPLRFVMHYTLPDVRHLNRHGDATKSVGYAYISTIMCLIWLIAGSYAMVASLEAVAALMGVPESVVGFTVSAAGTSLPAYVASRISAEKGFGNQAVANIFGSNTFNICVGLGLPWLIYTLGIGFKPYHELENDHILESILIMAGVLLIFLVLMVSTNFVLLRWHADLFIFLYILYIAFAICQVCTNVA